MAQAPSFGAEWWTRQWIGALEALGWAGRLHRGRTYARTGRVLSVSLEAGLAEARVRGSRPVPYRVTIRLPVFPRSVWGAILDLIAAKARYAGQLLAGEMPPDIDELFAGSGRSLFPRAEADLRTHCTCPDDANPCKHIAAVHYILGARFDADPFVLFHLRGMPPEVLLAELRVRRHVGGSTAVVPRDEPEPPRPVVLEGFHNGVNRVPDEPLEIDPPHIDAASFALSLPRALTTDARLLEALAVVARRAAMAASETL